MRRPAQPSRLLDDRVPMPSNRSGAYGGMGAFGRMEQHGIAGAVRCRDRHVFFHGIGLGKRRAGGERRYAQRGSAERAAGKTRVLDQAGMDEFIAHGGLHLFCYVNCCSAAKCGAGK